MEMCGIKVDILWKLFLVLAVIHHGKADMRDIVDQCCHQGSEWSKIDPQCYDIQKPIGIEEEHHMTCSTIMMVCCIKSRQTFMCDNGKTDSLTQGNRCAVRDDQLGAETYKECCKCCNLGSATRAMGMQCDAPGIGNPCDLKFMECCTGIDRNPEPKEDKDTDMSDIDECQLFGSQALCSQVCINTIGSYRCDCNPGYSLAEDGTTCFQAVETCERGNHNCSQECIDTRRGPMCHCREGYRLLQDRQSCEDIDECRAGRHNCRTDERCVNTNGSFTCESAYTDACAQGYVLDELTGRCIPIPQPSTDCQPGFAFNTVTSRCEDIDECRAGRHNCRTDERCVNTNGGFTCESAYKDACAQGYVLDEQTGRCIPIPKPSTDCQPGFAFNTVTSRCEDIDECIVQQHNCDKKSEACQNTMGSFYCACEDGFRRSAYNDRCEDIDECARRMDTCTTSERCENTEGSFVCRRLVPCGTGWTLNEETQQCVDQNECDVGTHNCRNGYDCFNLEGSFRCIPKQCPTGYRFSSSSGKCEAIDCPRGLRADTTSRCVDVNECEERPDICRFFQQCMNTYGSYRCVDPMDCGPGYQLDEAGVQCVDIDECAAGTHDCDSTSQCVNRRGSFTCSCPDGFRRINGQCVDRDECQYGLCPFNSRCENTAGSYTCTCNEGLENRGQQCVDIDECSVPNRCQHRCVNVVGSFQCTCNIGYQLAANGRNCEDVDECLQFGRRGRLCGGECINTPGSYMCTCPDGWRVLGNSRSCQDIDECEEGTDRCEASPDVMCFNTRGSHKCPRIICPPGFSRSSLGPRRNSVRCKRRSFTCRKGDTECLNAPLSVSFNFLTFPTNVKIPTDLFSMSGPQTAEKLFNWYLNITNVYPQDASVRPVQQNDFSLTIGLNNAVVSLENRIQGPQDIELKLTMQITDRYSGYTGYAYSNIYLYITSSTIA